MCKSSQISDKLGKSFNREKMTNKQKLHNSPELSHFQMFIS